MDLSTGSKLPLIKQMWRELRWMLGYAKGYRGVIVLTLALGAVSVLFGLGSSLASKYLLDSVIGRNPGSLAVFAAAMGACMLASVAVRAVSSRLSGVAGVKLKQKVRSDVFRRIMVSRWAPLHEKKSGDLLARVLSDSSSVSGTVLSFVPSVGAAGIQFTGAFVLLLIYDPVMALIALLCAPVSVLFSRLWMRRMRRSDDLLRKTDGEISAYCSEALAGIDTVKSFGIYRLFVRGLDKLHSRYFSCYEGYNRLTVTASAAMSVMGILVYAACFAWGVYRLWTDPEIYTYGTFTLFLGLASSLRGSFSSLVSAVPSLISATAGAGRIMEIFDLDAEPDPHEMTESTYGVRAEGVCFSYDGRRRVLDGFSLTADPGEAIAVTGSSGSGKTTLMRLMLGLADFEGRIVLVTPDGTEIPVSAATRRAFAYVPQGNTVFAGTVAENLRMVKEDATDEEIVSALKKACAYGFVSEMPGGINAVIGEKGAGISEGQAQRIAIARALLCDAPVILLDEATSALDSATERKIMDSIAAEGGRTCILSSHRGQVIESCTRTYRVGEPL